MTSRESLLREQPRGKTHEIDVTNVRAAAAAEAFNEEISRSNQRR